MAELQVWVSTVSSGIITLTALSGVAIAFFQLGRLNKTLRLNGLLGIIQLENEINSRRSQLLDTCEEIRMTRGKNKTVQERTQLKTLEQRLAVTTEAYLNAVDRLAFCILNGYFPEREWRTEYQVFIATDVSDHEEYFRADTRYDNVLKLHNKWKER